MMSSLASSIGRMTKFPASRCMSMGAMTINGKTVDLEVGWDWDGRVWQIDTGVLSRTVESFREVKRRFYGTVNP